MNVITPLVQFQQQLRIFHWQTDSYAQHKAFGKIYESLDDLVDSFVEKYMGTFGRSKPTTTFVLELKPLSTSNVDISIQHFIDYLKDMNNEIPDNTDLLNIRDEILGEIHQLKYLLSLK
jgi:DNA-binding ferritin-like protein